MRSPMTPRDREGHWGLLPTTAASAQQCEAAVLALPCGIASCSRTLARGRRCGAVPAYLIGAVHEVVPRSCRAGRSISVLNDHSSAGSAGWCALRPSTAVRRCTGETSAAARPPRRTASATAAQHCSGGDGLRRTCAARCADTRRGGSWMLRGRSRELCTLQCVGAVAVVAATVSSAVCKALGLSHRDMR